MTKHRATSPINHSSKEELAPRTDYFLPYQERWILDDSPMKLYEKSRRVGITYGTSYRCVRKCMTKPTGFTQWVSSRDMLTAKEFVTDYVAKWAKALNVVATGLEGIEKVIDESKGLTAFVVTFANGNRIVSLSSTPEAFAGKGGDVLLDEADLHKDTGNLIDMALPCTTWGGQLEIVSAYRVDGSPASTFAKLCSDAAGDNPMGWSFHRTTIDDAIAEGFVEKLNEVTGQGLSRDAFRASLKARCRNEAAFNSQYLCIAADDGGTLLSYTLIGTCEESKLQLQEALPALPRFGQFYAGMDIGRHRDLSVLWILEKVGDVFWTRCIIEMEKTAFRIQEHKLASFLKDFRIRRCCIDSNGIGAMLAENAAADFGELRAEQVTFSNTSKADMAIRMLRHFQDKLVRIPQKHAIREDLHKVRKSTTPSGNTRYEGERDGDGHADRFWALALALLAASDTNTIADGIRVGADQDPWSAPSNRKGHDRPDNTADLVTATPDKYAAY